MGHSIHHGSQYSPWITVFNIIKALLKLNLNVPNYPICNMHTLIGCSSYFKWYSSSTFPVMYSNKVPPLHDLKLTNDHIWPNTTTTSSWLAHHMIMAPHVLYNVCVHIGWSGIKGALINTQRTHQIDLEGSQLFIMALWPLNTLPAPIGPLVL